jgi:hypothetical protein
VINPANRPAWTFDRDGSREVKDGILRTENAAIELMLESVFDPK